MKKVILLTLMLLPLMQSASAECGNAQTQLEMNQCAAAEYRNADKALNNAYQQALQQTSGEQKKLLQSAQKQWIRFRDSDCQFQTYQSREGSVNPMNTALCLRTKTEQRTQELLSLLTCPEGDVSCAL